MTRNPSTILKPYLFRKDQAHLSVILPLVVQPACAGGPTAVQSKSGGIPTPSWPLFERISRAVSMTSFTTAPSSLSLFTTIRSCRLQRTKEWPTHLRPRLLFGPAWVLAVKKGMQGATDFIVNNRERRSRDKVTKYTGYLTTSYQPVVPMIMRETL